MNYIGKNGLIDWNLVFADFNPDTTEYSVIAKITGKHKSAIRKRASEWRERKGIKRIEPKTPNKEEIAELLQANKESEYKEKRNTDGSIEITDVVDRKLTDEEIFDRYGRNREDWRISMVWFKDRKSGYLLSCCFIPLLKEKKESEFKEELIKIVKSISPVINRKLKPSGGVLLEIDVFDPHFGKLAWRHETGEDYDISITTERYHNAIYNLLEKASKTETIERIIFPVGNDLLHTDTMAGTTTAGTRQDIDSRFQKMWLQTRKAVMEANKMCEEVAPVDVPIVPSNHDFQTLFYLGDLLECYYANNKNININNSPKSRKYYKWGNCGIGYTHGNEENINQLPLIMMREQQQEWSDVKYMEWHIGHHHRKKQVQFTSVDDVKGIMVRFLRSISSADAWHYLKGYVGTIKGAEAFIWHKKDGLVSNIMHNL